MKQNLRKAVLTGNGGDDGDVHTKTVYTIMISISISALRAYSPVMDRDLRFYSWHTAANFAAAHSEEIDRVGHARPGPAPAGGRHVVFIDCQPCAQPRGNEMSVEDLFWKPSAESNSRRCNAEC
jgi:hypothetical protein